MLPWFLLALGSAVTYSIYNALGNHLVSLGRFSKFTIVFWTNLIGLIILLGLCFLFGFPEIQPGFWTAVIITGVINSITAPLMLKAYELGEFSSVVSMMLLSPIFLLGTSFLFLGEVPSLMGIFGVVLIVAGLSVVMKSANKSDVEVLDSKSGKINRGNLLAIFVALFWSVSVNFDKLAVMNSNVFFAPMVILGIMTLLNGVYLVFTQRNNLKESFKNWKFSRQLIIFPVGIVFAVSIFFFNSALLAGLASYTVAVKRLAVVFGIFWGWLFFKEKNIGKKLLGSSIAVAGVVAIIFS